MYLKISPMKRVVRFGKKEKMSPHYVGPYELPSELASVHPVFHVSMLKKCIVDPEFILLIEGLGVKDNLSYEEVPVKILDSQVVKLRNK